MSRACCVDHIVRPSGDSKEVVASCETSTLKRKREDGREEDKDDSRQRRDEAMMGEFEVNQEADDLEDEGELEDYQEDVYDNRTGELLDAKLTMRAENEEMTYMEQLDVGIESTEEEC